MGEEKKQPKMFPAFGEMRRFDQDHCASCGDCCKGKVVGIGGSGIIQISNCTKTPGIFLGRPYIDSDKRRIPKMRWKLVGAEKHCYFFLNNRCKLQQNHGLDVKPGVCRVFPFAVIAEVDVPKDWTSSDKDNVRHTVASPHFSLEDPNVYVASIEGCPALGKGKSLTIPEIYEKIQLTFLDNIDINNTAKLLEKGEVLSTKYDTKLVKRLNSFLSHPNLHHYRNHKKGKSVFSCFFVLSEKNKNCMDKVDFEKVLACIKNGQEQLKLKDGSKDYWLFALQDNYKHLGVMVGMPQNFEKDFLVYLLRNKFTIGIQTFNQAFYDFKTGECCALHI